MFLYYCTGYDDEKKNNDMLFKYIENNSVPIEYLNNQMYKGQYFFVMLNKYNIRFMSI